MCACKCKCVYVPEPYRPRPNFSCHFPLLPVFLRFDIVCGSVWATSSTVSWMVAMAARPATGILSSEEESGGVAAE